MTTKSNNIDAMLQGVDDTNLVDPPPEQVKAFPFMKFPPELRNDIYERVFNAAVTENIHTLDPYSRPHRPKDAVLPLNRPSCGTAQVMFRTNVLALPHTNQKIRQEILSLYADLAQKHLRVRYVHMFRSPIFYVSAVNIEVYMFCNTWQEYISDIPRKRDLFDMFVFLYGLLERHEYEEVESLFLVYTMLEATHQLLKYSELLKQNRTRLIGAKPG
ncbi:hypothetical protein Q7P37_009012 [Cladosporium fusiforme]